MANIRLVKGRIKSAGNIAQITRAMELVSASKMKRAQAAAISGKPYANKIYSMVMELAGRVDASLHPLLQKPKNSSAKRLVIYITTNKGLCGGLNTASFRYLVSQYTSFSALSFVTLGTKGAGFVSQMGGNVEADFSSTTPWEGCVPAIIDLVVSRYLSGEISGVDIVSNEFISAIKHQSVRKTILPLTVGAGMDNGQAAGGEFLIEPNPEEVFEALLPHYLENQLRDAILQSEASEHSARMMAMRNATDNALSLVDDLTLMYNKARQENITYEISDLVTARLAVEI